VIDVIAVVKLPAVNVTVMVLMELEILVMNAMVKVYSTVVTVPEKDMLIVVNVVQQGVKYVVLVMEMERLNQKRIKLPHTKYVLGIITLKIGANFKKVLKNLLCQWNNLRNLISTYSI
jgi:hypothetical protein